MRKPSGFLLWEDAVRACVLTGLDGCDNRKTGDMLQTWVLVKSEDPIAALKSGRDRLVCGNCKLRGKLCYVDKARAPYVIWHALQRGRYPKINLKELDPIKGHRIRFGAYGDPVFVPSHVWFQLADVSDGWTGYTHQWRSSKASALKPLVMASVDAPDEQIEAQSMGWRTFRARRPEHPQFPDEVVCPASDEAGKKTTCSRCLLCNGAWNTGKNVVINAHGSSRAKFGV